MILHLDPKFSQTSLLADEPYKGHSGVSNSRSSLKLTDLDNVLKTSSS